MTSPHLGASYILTTFLRLKHIGYAHSLQSSISFLQSSSLSVSLHLLAILQRVQPMISLSSGQSSYCLLSKHLTIYILVVQELTLSGAEPIKFFYIPLLLR